MSKQDYYTVLGVNKSSSKDEIKKAYRKLAMQYHPDRNPGAENEAKFKEVSEAASVLLDDQKKARYDQFGHAGVDGAAGGGAGGFGFGGDFSDLSDIFGDIFGDFMGGGGRRTRKRSSARPGNDLQLNLKIKFEEAAFGATKKVNIMRFVSCDTCQGSGAKDGQSKSCDYCAGKGEVRRQQGFFTVATTCPKCQGSGEMISNPCSTCSGKGQKRKEVELEVKIPPGIDTGQRLKLSGEGDAGVRGGESGDLYLLVEVEDHAFFQREEQDIICQVPISFSQAALGAEIDVPTLGGMVKLSIPAGTQSGKKMRLRGKGLPRLDQYGVGDQIVTIQLETPTKIGSEERALFEQLARLSSGNSNPISKGFFEKVRDLFN